MVLMSAVRRVFTSAPVTGSFTRWVPVARWPAILGRAHSIKVPARQRHSLSEPTPDCESNIRIIFDLLSGVASLPGDVIECGVYQGATLAAEALWLRQAGLDKHLFGCDSFQGFDDEHVSTEMTFGGRDDPDKRPDGFSDTSIALVQSKLDCLGVSHQVTLLPGFFSQTLPSLADREFCFVHLDCDLYDSYRDCLEILWPRLVAGGVILFDEYNDTAWPGCNKAVDEFLAQSGAALVTVESECFVKHYVRKEPISNL